MNYQELVQPWGRLVTDEPKVIGDGVFQLTLADGRRVVLKALGPTREPVLRRLEFEREVLLHVEQTGLAAAVPLLTSAGQPYSLAGGQVYSLACWLPNQPAALRSEREREQLYRSYGTAIARFHQALASYEDSALSSRTWRTDLQQVIFEEALPTLAAGLEPAQWLALKTVLEPIEPAMRAAYTDLPAQLIIRDCHPGNVTVDGLEVTGFVDCDHISIGPRIFDMAEFLVHLIKFGMGTEAEELGWLTQFHQVIQAYQSVAPLAPREQAAIYAAMLAIPLIFIDFFVEIKRTEAIALELRLFEWLVRQRDSILAQIEAGGES